MSKGGCEVIVLQSVVFSSGGMHESHSIHDIVLSTEKRLTFSALHAISSCDSTSHLFGVNKSSFCKIFVKNHNFLRRLADRNFDEAAQFVIRLHDSKL